MTVPWSPERRLVEPEKQKQPRPVCARPTPAQKTNHVTLGHRQMVTDSQFSKACHGHKVRAAVTVMEMAKRILHRGAQAGASQGHP